MAALASTVYVTDPDSHQTVTLAPGTCPEPRLAALVTNPAAWVNGKLPRLPKAKTEGEADGPQGPTGDGPDDAAGDTSASAGAEQPSTEQAAPAAKKTAAKKTAAPVRSRGRDAAGEGDSGD